MHACQLIQLTYGDIATALSGIVYIDVVKPLMYFYCNLCCVSFYHVILKLRPLS